MRRFAPLLLFTIFACILLWPVFLQGKVLLQPCPTDESLSSHASGGVYTSKVVLGHAIRAGEIPLWNPYIGGGVPFIEEPSNGVLYPPNWLYAVLPPDLAFTLLAILHLVGAGIFMWVFLRGLGLGGMSAVFGGTAFMLSSTFVLHLGEPEYLSSSIWIPLALHLCRVTHDRRSARFAVASALVLGMSMLGGQLGIGFLTLAVVGLYWIFLMATSRAGAVGSKVGLGALSLGLALALAAPQILPAAEMASRSAKIAQEVECFDLVGLFAPGLLSGNGHAGLIVYVGLLPIMLVAYAFRSRDVHRTQGWFFAGITVVAAVCATSKGAVIHAVTPVWGSADWQYTMSFLLALSLPILGAIGFERVVTPREERRRVDALTAVISAVVWTAVVVLLSVLCIRAGTADHMMQRIYVAVAVFISGFVLILVMSLQKLQRYLGGVLLIVVLASDLLVYGIGSCLVFDCDHTYTAPEWRLDKVHLNGETLPRAFLVHSVEFAQDDEACRRLEEREADPRSVALVHPDESWIVEPWWMGKGIDADKKPSKGERVEIERDSCNRVQLKVRVGYHKPTVLVLADRYHRGWKASVDGRSAPIARADVHFRAVSLPSGEHAVEFTYAPESFERGMRYSKVALVFILGFGIYLLAKCMPANRKEKGQ